MIPIAGVERAGWRGAQGFVATHAYVSLCAGERHGNRAITIPRESTGCIV